jgi:uncharacterized membrane protein
VQKPSYRGRRLSDDEQNLSADEQERPSMNNDQSNTELIFTLFMMGVLLVLCVVAVVVFFRVWRKERKAGGRKFFE